MERMKWMPFRFFILKSVQSVPSVDKPAMNHIITLGESLGCLTPEQNGPLRHATTFTRRMAGAEGNTAIGLARLGIPARWLGRVGEDEVGKFIATALRGEGVETFAISAAP